MTLSDALLHHHGANAHLNLLKAHRVKAQNPQPFDRKASRGPKLGMPRTSDHKEQHVYVKDSKPSLPTETPKKPGLNHSWLTKISIHRWHSLLSVCLDASMVAYHYNIICPCLIPALSRTLIRLQQPKHTELRTPRPLQVKHKTYSQVLSLFVLCYTNQRVLLCVNAFLVLSWQGLCLLNQPPSPARIANSVI